MIVNLERQMGIADNLKINLKLFSLKHVTKRMGFDNIKNETDFMKPFEGV